MDLLLLGAVQLTNVTDRLDGFRTKVATPSKKKKAFGHGLSLAQSKPRIESQSFENGKIMETKLPPSILPFSLQAATKIALISSCPLQQVNDSVTRKI